MAVPMQTTRSLMVVLNSDLVPVLYIRGEPLVRNEDYMYVTSALKPHVYLVV